MNKALFLSILFFCGCNTTTNPKEDVLSQDQLFQRDGTTILGEIDKMVLEDQNIRNYFNYGTIDTNKIDSLERLTTESGLPMNFAVENTENSNFLSKTEKDSVDRIIDLLQTKHTKRLIEIISKYGYPTSERLGTQSTIITPEILLHHPDIRYKDTLLILLAKELSLKRLDTNTFEMTKWDLNGREGIPNIKGIRIVKVNPKTGKTDTLQQ